MNHSQAHQTAVQLRGVSKVYRQGKTDARDLDDLSLSIPTRQFVAIMGASGSGKSTLLHLIAGLTAPSSGTLTLFGQALNSLSDDDLTIFRRRQIGFIFQAFNLLPTMTALENVCLPLLMDGKPLAAIRPKGVRLLEQVGLADRQQHRPDELSGGQQQRVAIARALINASDA